MLNKLNKYFTILLLILLLIGGKNALAIVNFDINYYGNRYIYKSDYRFSFRENYFDNLINIGGYIKQVNIDKSGFENYLVEHNDVFNLSRKIDVDEESKNYFYKVYVGLKLFDFNYFEFKNSVFFNVSYYDSIKYFDYLKLTFVDDIYKRYGFGLDYYINGSNFTTNLFIDYIMTADKIKDTISTGISTQYNINSALTLVAGYDYSKDFIRNDKQQSLMYDFIMINYSYEDIKNESHNFRLNTILKLDDFININLGLSYLISKDYDNSFGFNVSLGF